MFEHLDLAGGIIWEGGGVSLGEVDHQREIGSAVLEADPTSC